MLLMVVQGEASILSCAAALSNSQRNVLVWSSPSLFWRHAEGMQEDNDCWLHCLNLAALLLEGMPSKTVRPLGASGGLFSLADISRRLVIPAMFHAGPSQEVR